MERGSDKHGPQLDDELQKEFESIERGAPGSPRVEEHREIEEEPLEEAAPEAPPEPAEP